MLSQYLGYTREVLSVVNIPVVVEGNEQKALLM